MANHDEEQQLSREERQYLDFMNHGDDFDKIEIWRAARKWYQKALYMHLHDEEAQKKIDACTANIKAESKIINIIAAVAAILVIGLIIRSTFF